VEGYEFVFQGAAAIYALRIPTGSLYGSGPLIRVRRSSDNAELDIGASGLADGNGNRWLDEVALLAHVGVGDGFVTTWYDQSGSAINATQATALTQPRIVSAGVVDKLNGVPTVVYSGAQSLDTAVVGITQHAVVAVVAVNLAGAPTQHIIRQGVSPFWLIRYQSASNNWRYTNNSPTLIGGEPVTNTLTIVTGVATDGARGRLLENGVQIASGGSSTPFLTTAVIALGSHAGIDFFTGALSEVVVFGAPYISQALERNQGTAFGIAVA